MSGDGDLAVAFAQTWLEEAKRLLFEELQAADVTKDWQWRESVEQRLKGRESQDFVDEWQEAHRVAAAAVAAEELARAEDKRNEAASKKDSTIPYTKRVPTDLRKLRISGRSDALRVLEIAYANILIAEKKLFLNDQDVAVELITAFYYLGMASRRSLASQIAKDREEAERTEFFNAVRRLLKKHCPEGKWTTYRKAAAAITPFLLEDQKLSIWQSKAERGSEVVAYAARTKSVRDKLVALAKSSRHLKRDFDIYIAPRRRRPGRRPKGAGFNVDAVLALSDGS